MKAGLLSLFFALLFAVGCSSESSSVNSPVTPPATSKWSIQVVDSVGDVGEYARLAVDDSGNVAISYLNRTSKMIRCARLRNGVWTRADVGNATGINVTKGYNAIALKGDGSPVITYHKADVSYYMTSWTGSAWTTPTAIGWTEAAWAFMGTHSVAVNKSTGAIYAAVSCYDSRAGNVLGFWTSPAAQAVALDGPTLGGTGTNPSIAVAPSGDIHIAYEYEFDGSSVALLKYAKRVGAAWSTSIVDSMGDGGNFTTSLTSIALDPTGNPHIIYYRLNAGYKYARWNGTSWSKSLIDSYGSVGWDDQSIAVDKSGNPHVAFLTGSYKLQYGYLLGGAWVKEVVNTQTGFSCSIGVDARGKVYIAYYNDGTGRLELATRTP
jgi:hypothetical protein